MIQSMTGFVSKSIILEAEQSNKVRLFISIKSLNSRYFDITCKLPYVINQYEIELIRLVKSKLFRGHVHLLMNLDDPNAFKTSIEPAIATISGYVQASKKIKEKFDLQDSLTLSDILKIPNTFILEEKGIDIHSKNLIFATVNELLEDLIFERQREGNSIKKDLEERISLMQQKIDEISVIFEKLLNEQKEKIGKKIQEINEINNENAESQRQMLYITLDKMDIHEEISRFQSHLANLKKLINSSSAEKGKQLDFILQELFREINTITAKTANAQIVDLAIATKVEIEKSREQGQNLV